MWTMPANVLRIVAFILAACAIGGFVMGLRSTPERARLPGEGGAAPALEASDARPLEDLVLTPSELAPEPPKEEEKPEEKAEEEAAPMIVPPAPVEAPKAAPAPATPPADEDRVGDLIDGLTPPPEQPPY
jgi:hypothetical protein